MTVTDVLLAFRTALLAIVPVMDSLSLPWRRPDAYDQWDNIASALYDNLVCYTLAWALPEERQGELRLSPYDTLAASYSAYSVIEVVGDDGPGGPGILVFHAFGTTREPFDVVEAVRVDGDGHRMNDVLEFVPVEKARFRLRLTQASFAVDIRDDVPVAAITA